MSESEKKKRAATLRYGGPPIRLIWAWVVIDQDGREAFCRSPWSETHVLMSPDQENIDTPMMAEWCRSYYGDLGMRVELRCFGDIG